MKISKTWQKNTLPNVNSHHKHQLDDALGQFDFEKSLREAKGTESNEETEDSFETRQSLKYSTHCAYKALKLLTVNKRLDFDPKLNEASLKESLLESFNASYENSDEESMSPETEVIEKVEADDGNSLYLHDAQKKLKSVCLKNFQFKSRESRYSTFKSAPSTSRTISTGSRSTSGSSSEFVHPEVPKIPSASVLSAIPKLSGFPRKTRDRCLSCMYKPFETPEERKISLPRTSLQKFIFSDELKKESEKRRVERPSEDVSNDSESSAVTMPDFENEVNKIANNEVPLKDVRFPEDLKTSQSPSSELIPPSSRVECEEPVKKQDTELKDLREAKNETKTRLEVNADFNSLSNVEAAKVDSTVVLEFSESSKILSMEQSSEEDNSLVASINDDQSNKYFVPCHAPTVFRPSLEPLRALRHKKPKTLQDLIDMNEAVPLGKSDSVDDYYDDVRTSKHPGKTIESADKSAVTKTLQKAILIKDKEDTADKHALPGNRVLSKTKSVSEKLFLGKSEVPSKEDRVLRKGSSLINLAHAAKDVETSKSVISEIGLNEELEKLDIVRDEDSEEKKSSDGTKKLPLTSTDDILEILEEFEEDASTTIMLESLCKEFSTRVSKDFESSDFNEKKSKKIVRKLVELLVDSKRYLHPDKFPSDLVFSAKQPFLCNPRQLRRILPLESYNLVAPLLGLPKWYPRMKGSVKDVDLKSQRISRKCSCDEISSDRVVHPPTSKGSKSLDDIDESNRPKYNPYGLFLMKPRRKVVTWRPLTEADMEGYDPDATLKMRTDNIMRKICQDFCQWIESLGGTDKVIDEEVLRDMFEIDFKAEACRAMQISIREMPMVPTEVALTRNSPGASKLAMTRKHLLKDARAERKHAKITAFGSSIPPELRFVPPNNKVHKRWLECENVPRDLETMDVVWKDITHLDSVKGFVKWLQEHPEVPQPEALKTIVSMDIDALKPTEEDETFAHLELDITQIENLKVG